MKRRELSWVGYLRRQAGNDSIDASNGVSELGAAEGKGHEPISRYDMRALDVHAHAKALHRVVSVHEAWAASQSADLKKFLWKTKRA